MLVIPKLSATDDLRQYAEQQKLIELLRIPAQHMRMPTPDAFTDQQAQLESPYEISLYLFLNDRSLLFDPINWSHTKERLNVWSKTFCPEALLTSNLDQKFAERMSPSHLHRVHGKFVSATIHLLSLMDPDCEIMFQGPPK